MFLINSLIDDLINSFNRSALSAGPEFGRIYTCKYIYIYIYITICSCARDRAFVPTPAVHPPGTRVLF